MALSNASNVSSFVANIFTIVGVMLHATLFIVIAFSLIHRSINAELGEVDVLVYSMTEDGFLGSPQLFDGNNWRDEYDELQRECDELDARMNFNKWNILRLLHSYDIVGRILSARARISRLHKRLRSHSISMSTSQSASDDDVSPCSPQPIWFTPATTPLIESYSDNNDERLTLHRNDSDSDVTVCSETEQNTESDECCDSNSLASPLAAGAYDNATGFTTFHRNDSEATMCSETEKNTDLDQGCPSVLSKESECNSDIDDEKDEPAAERDITYDTTTFTPRRILRERLKLVIENLKPESATDQASSIPDADAYQSAPDDSNIQILREKFLAWSGYLIGLFQNARNERAPSRAALDLEPPV